MITKICGLKSVEIAVESAKLKPNLIGFVFAKSRRQVTPELAGEMISAIREVNESPQTVGVFVDPSLEELEQTLMAAPLDIIQLHGNETPDFCRSIKQRFQGIQVYKVFSAPLEEEDLPEQSELDAYLGCIDGMLLDKPGGGTGTVFAWEVIPFYQDWARTAGIPLLIAGGLNPDNVRVLLASYKPDGVDVSSGVETGGEKDIALIRAFIERVNSIA
jgi:phosphoribosylanthranilate isomerase